ncbi:hypothetical protein L211DRAFT_839633 [Terfezia boudieri ATCC MYA-4762]|uniref:Uncharacterized protein n=1 Tax=Terfezia boudieri ATCC MYA-4762 TaxID=1051890 RepID=A0A3N4LIJ1_9PEZI|nr:hypothetical protein L211DRAFT_839633 [Terfezia boudieri ATCC MYA-4762]
MRHLLCLQLQLLKHALILLSLFGMSTHSAMTGATLKSCYTELHKSAAICLV